MKKHIFRVFISLFAVLSFSSCGGSSGDDDVIRYVTEPAVTEEIHEEKVPENNEETVSETENEYIDNVWAAFLVSPSNPAYTYSEQGNEILRVLSNDSVIGDIASMTLSSPAPYDTTAYGTEVITAGGPVSYDQLAYGSLTEVPDSFLNAMVSDMKNEIGSEYGDHSGGAGMGYRTFYQASYDADTGELLVNQENGYWARTLGAFSEHCAGVAVDFDISYNNSEYLESTGRENRAGDTAAEREFAWLADNAHNYGFIWRYKIDGSDYSRTGNQTGTIREGWHWRFVGVYNATKFWEMCAADTNGDGTPDTGYMINDDYIWEDYVSQNIEGRPEYPQNEYEALCSFYNSPKGNRCTYDEYQTRMKEDN